MEEENRPTPAGAVDLVVFTGVCGGPYRLPLGPSPTRVFLGSGRDQEIQTSGAERVALTGPRAPFRLVGPSQCSQHSTVTPNRPGRVEVGDRSSLCRPTGTTRQSPRGGP